MPPNFFVTLPDGTLLRRVVSTYISPLGVAYTGLLLFPLGVVLIDRQRARSSAKWLAIAALTLVLIGVMFAVTRLALFALVGGAGLMWLLLRRGWIAAVVPVLVVASVLMLYPFALLPVTVTSDVWGDLSVTYLLWWAAGASATLAARRSASPVVARASVRTSPVTPLA